MKQYRDLSTSLLTFELGGSQGGGGRWDQSQEGILQRSPASSGTCSYGESDRSRPEARVPPHTAFPPEFRPVFGVPDSRVPDSDHGGSSDARRRRRSGGHRRTRPRGHVPINRPEPGSSPRVGMQIGSSRRIRLNSACGTTSAGGAEPLGKLGCAPSPPVAGSSKDTSPAPKYSPRGAGTPIGSQLNVVQSARCSG